MINIEYWKQKDPFRNVSFSSDKRINGFLEGYQASLNNILEYATAKRCTDEQKARLEYKYDKLNEAFLSAASRCVSVMIVGGSKFPVARAEKANNHQQKALEALIYFDDNYTRIIDRWTRVKETPNDQRNKWLQRIQILESNQEQMKRANAIIRKTAGLEEQIEQLKLIGLSKAVINEITRANCFGGFGFEGFQLSNNLANIKRLKEQVALIDKKQSTTEEDYISETVQIKNDKEELRINIYFNDIPDADTRSRLKHRGFKWSPNRKAWTRSSKNMNVKTALSLVNGEGF